MLKIEKTLKELRDLQNTLRELGIEMFIKDADAETKSDYEDAAMTIDVYEPCRCFAWDGMDGVIHMRWNSYPDAFAWFRMNLLLDLARGYMLKADNITKSWTARCRHASTRMPPTPSLAKPTSWPSPSGMMVLETSTCRECEPVRIGATSSAVRYALWKISQH